jgi:RNA polymerase sigma factor (TIGR02999 family)
LTEKGDITLLLRQWGGGDPTALEGLFALVYPQLKQIARSLFRGEKPENLLQPTVLVNELYLKLLRNHSLMLEDRAHFYSFAARLMRRVLLDQARMENRLKRDGGLPVQLSDELIAVDGSDPEILDLDRALTELDHMDARKCRMLELRFFLGFTAEETGELLGVSKATVDRDLKFARSWLYDKLHPSN